MSLPSESDRDQLLTGEEAQHAIAIIAELKKSGFVAYLAGGCVRDALLGRIPKDYDVATNATPDAVREVFGKRRTLAFGASFGVIGVLPQRRPGDRDRHPVQPTEVATFRSDGTYSDGRRPDSVHFGDAEQDALRRDFTINGLFYEPEEHQVIDFVGGQADLQAGVLRTIGDAALRIEEDKLRDAPGRAFCNDAQVRDRSRDDGRDLGTCLRYLRRQWRTNRRRNAARDPLRGSSRRTAHLAASRAPRGGTPRGSRSRLGSFSADQSSFGAASFSKSLACLLFSLADPKAALKRLAADWRLSNEERRQAEAAQQHWQTVVDASDLPWSEVQPVLIDRDIDVILALATAAARANNLPAAGLERVNEALTWPHERLDPAPLLTGDDLRQLGVPAGPAYRNLLEAIRDAQLNRQITSREDAIALLQTLQGGS